MFCVHCGVKLCIPLLVLATVAGWAFAQKPGTPEKGVVSALIDKLQDVAEGDVGYMPTRSGNGFLPLGTSQAGALLLGQKPPASSGTMRELVKSGPPALPQLIPHLHDRQPTKITITHKFDFASI